MSLLYYMTGIVSGVLFSTGLLSLLLSFKNIERKLNSSYTLFSVFIFFSILIAPINIPDNSIEMIILYEKINNYLLLFAAVAIVYFVEAYTGYISRNFRIIIFAHIIILAIFNIVSQGGFVWAEIDGLGNYETFNSEKIYFLLGKTSYSIYFAYSLLLILLALFYTSSRFLRKSGHFQKSLILIISLGLVIIFLTSDLALSEYGIKRIMYFNQLAYLVFAVLVAYINFENIFNVGEIKKKLIDRDEQFRLIAENFKDIIAIHDMTGKLIYVSPSVFHVLGYTPDEALNLPATSLYHPDELDLLRDKLKNISDQKWVHRIRRKDGIYIWIEVSTSIMYENRKPIKFLAISRDITDHIKYERELELAKQKAEEADKLKSDFLTQISHEIRSPMNMILSFVSLFKAELEEKITGDLKEGFSIIESAGRRITRTINLIVDMSQIKANSFECKFKEYDLYCDIINNVYLEFKGFAENKGLKLNVIKNNEKTIVKIDEYSVSQMFQNLIDNAIKYTDEGEIDILLGQSEKDEVIVVIKDTGIGISEEYIPKIFEPFMQEEQGYTRSYDGNGLGLALVKEYCNMNKIEIEVESKKNKGTEFKLTFLKSR